MLESSTNRNTPRCQDEAYLPKAVIFQNKTHIDSDAEIYSLKLTAKLPSENGGSLEISNPFPFLGFPMHSPGSSWGSDLSSEARNYLQFHSGRCITPRGFTIDDSRCLRLHLKQVQRGSPSCGPPECWRAWSKADKKNCFTFKWNSASLTVGKVPCVSCCKLCARSFLPHARQIPISKKLCAQKITGCWICKVRIWIWY